MRPDRKAFSVSAVAAPGSDTLRCAERNVDSRASSRGIDHGSVRLSVLSPRASASSRRIRRDQSSAPTRIQADWMRARSADSTSMARHCCHIAVAAKVATSATVSMAASSAAPR